MLSWTGLFGKKPSPHQRATTMYMTYLPMLRRRCRRFFREDALVEDALQEIFAAILKGIDGFRGGPQQELPWLYRITTTHCIRLASKEQLWSECLKQPWDEESEDFLAPAQHTTPSTDQQILATQLLNKLPANEREVLLLRYMSGLTQDEIAEVMHVSRNQIRRWLTSAEEKARRMASSTTNDAPDTPSLPKGGTK
jgi:RNA polymerase sigma-70 factor (ECF subfamily)